MTPRFAIVNGRATMLAADFDRTDRLIDVALTIPELPMYDEVKRGLMMSVRELRPVILRSKYQGEHRN